MGSAFVLLLAQLNPPSPYLEKTDTYKIAALTLSVQLLHKTVL